MSSRTRAAAARGIARVIEGGSLNELLPAIIADLSDPADRGLLQELVYGTLRYAPRLEFILSQLLDRPLRKREPRVHALLLVGLYQILHTRIPPHAAVAETVEAARVMRKQWAAGLTNAVLRRFQREQEKLLAKADAHPVGRSAHPDWLLDALTDAWPDDVENIVAANNARGPMSLRVNSRRGSRDDYLERLSEAGIPATAHPLAADAIQLDSPCDVQALPGFVEGDVSVQDVAAQLAVDVLDPKKGERVLDACAAPGGKTAHIAERCPELEELVAIDKDEMRLDRVAENLARLELAARLFPADAARPEEWWDEQPFDRILLDAPCSATGVIRRHPDIKLLRKKRDIEALASLQSRLLDRLWELLAPGGRLVYATCSVLPRENAQQIANFVERHDDVVPMPLAVDWGRSAGFGRQILPGEQDMDGFFYAVLAKA